MGAAKGIIVKPISSADAGRIVKRLHYSGKVTQNSQLHLGVFLDGRCGGALQFGPSLDKRKIIGLVESTKWNEFLELNRMALADWLPRNGESRAIAMAMRFIRKHYPHIQWVVSFADGTQCGDGTIYRASGFVLTGITNREDMYRFPDGTSASLVTFKKSKWAILNNGSASGRNIVESMGAVRLPGFQLRYIYFLDPTARQRLTVPIIPFNEIDRRGAGMYRGVPRVRSVASDTPGDQPGEGGATPTRTLLTPSPAPAPAPAGRPGPAAPESSAD